jgi:hypothetical protein
MTIAKYGGILTHIDRNVLPFTTPRTVTKALPGCGIRVIYVHVDRARHPTGSVVSPPPLARLGIGLNFKAPLAAPLSVPAMSRRTLQD